MQHVSALLFRIVLTACLALYGSFGIAKAGSNTAYSMVICADGVTKTVLFGADGVPVDPVQRCADCLSCCHAFGVAGGEIHVAASAFNALSRDAGFPTAQDPILNSRNIFPAPRGPPAARFSMQNMSRLMTSVQPDICHILRSDGRSHSKDANA